MTSERSGTSTPKRLGSLSIPVCCNAPLFFFLHVYSWLPDVLRIKGSIILRISGPVLTVTLWATLVCYLNHIGYTLHLTNNIVPMLSVVVSELVTVSSSSYDRYWEGRKSWASLTSNIRNLSRQIWVNSALPPEDKIKNAYVNASWLRRKKLEALRLLTAFPFAVKHYLREEEGLDWSDLRDTLPASFGKYRGNRALNTEHSHLAESMDYNSTGNSSLENSGFLSETVTSKSLNATKRVRPKRSKHHLPSSSTPLLGGTSINFDAEESMPLPLVIAHELSRILFAFRREGVLEVVGPAGTNAMTAWISSMVDHMTEMERVANTPIPVSYSIHLKQCVTLYLFALPLTLANELSWGTIPIVTVVSFTFMGIEGIADEIEMPFGDDPADLPLDRYCCDLKEEINFLIKQLPDGGPGTGDYDDGEGDD
ncbi:Bestrophin, RFP-TM, chloride channel-domain-containing protein [Flagelloscypha sp. PMI_526]|nr:Bestrophin, RFP-TM, chloride channel-domain-containing protein [Flagelloscypha sp. PMI_526]